MISATSASEHEQKHPGHPESWPPRASETTTGPLGQGISNGVGMAIAESFLSAHFNRPGFDIVDHYTYVICSDGDFDGGGGFRKDLLHRRHLKVGELSSASTTTIKSPSRATPT